MNEHDEKSMPTFSIIMPAYNEEKHIEEAILSILRQSYRKIELIVVDDGSTDDTWGIICKLQKSDERLKGFRPGKLGKNGAFNFGAQNSTGDWFSFFAADDVMEPGILEKWYACIKEKNGEQKEIVVASRMRMFSGSNTYSKYNNIEIPKNKNEVCKSGAAFLASKAVMEHLFPIPVGYPNEDGWTQLYFKYLIDEFIPCPEICVNYRIHEGNSLNKNAKFKTFNSQYHARRVIDKEFIAVYKDRLNKSEIDSLTANYQGEMYRYNGKLFHILFLKNMSVKDKIRLVLLSNTCFYAIKLFLNRFLLGHA